MCKEDWSHCCCCSVIQSCPTLCNPIDCSMPGFPVHHQPPELAQTHAHWVSDAIQTSLSQLTPSPPSFNLSQHQGFFPMSWLFTLGSQSIGASASASALPVNIHGLSSLRLTGLISLLFKGLSGVFSSTTVGRLSILQCSAFFMVRLSQPYVTTGKIIALIIWTSVSREMSLLLNTLSRFVKVFMPRSNHLLITWLQSPSAVILEPKKRKSVTISTFSPSICHEVMGPDALTFVFF